MKWVLEPGLEPELEPEPEPELELEPEPEPEPEPEQAYSWKLKPPGKPIALQQLRYHHRKQSVLQGTGKKAKSSRIGFV